MLEYSTEVLVSDFLDGVKQSACDLASIAQEQNCA
jgi:hypothetical protein